MNGITLNLISTSMKFADHRQDMDGAADIRLGVLRHGWLCDKVSDYWAIRPLLGGPVGQLTMTDRAVI
jgi:hypothetical protein